MTVRSTVIDVLKGLGISLIVIGHAKNLVGLQEFISFLFLFHVPLFFMISGLTLSFNDSIFKQFDRVVSLFITYVVLSLIALPKLLFVNHSHDVIGYLQGVVYGTGHTIIVTPIWFLTCLGLSILLASFFLHFVSSKKLLAIMVAPILFLGAYFLTQQNYVFSEIVGWGSIEKSGYLWNFDIAILGAGFIILGTLFRDYISRDVNFEIDLIGFFICLILTLFIYYFFSVKVDLNFRMFLPWSLAPISALTGIFSIIFLSRVLDRFGLMSKIFITIGQSSLVILFLHRDIQIIITKLISKFNSQIANSINIYTFIGLFILPILISVVIDFLFIRKSMILKKIIYPRPKLFQR